MLSIKRGLFYFILFETILILKKRKEKKRKEKKRKEKKRKEKKRKEVTQMKNSLFCNNYAA